MPCIKRKHHKLFEFGIQAFSLSPFSSLNSNARMIIENEHTASSKVYRLSKNPKILSYTGALLKAISLVKSSSLVNVDFSDFCGFQTLAFGVQTQVGRAIPVWANCLTYPIVEVGSQNLFVLDEIKRFKQALGFSPSFVFDRGFWIPEMMKFFLSNQITFYLRIKKNTHFKFTDSGPSQTALKIGKHSKDVTLSLFSSKIRLIVSPPPEAGIRRSHTDTPGERWYILTNDFKSSRKKILNIYRCRFEIEETFKDLKHIFDLDRLFIKQKQTFKILLFFCMVSFWLAFLFGSVMHPKDSCHFKKRRSYFRVWWEGIQREIKVSGLGALRFGSG